MSGAILPFSLVHLWLAVELRYSYIYILQWNYVTVTFTLLRENSFITPYAGGSREMDKEIWMH